jgi:multidrug efflux pump
VAFTKLRDRYEHFLDVVLNNRVAVYVVAGLILVSLAPLFMMTKKELAPAEDRGFIVSITKGAPNATLDDGVPNAG